MTLRLMVYDRTCTGRPLLPGLTHTWWAGAWLYRALGRFDDWRGVASWEEALAWLTAHDAPIAEVQYWGHGRWGHARIGPDILDAARLAGDLRQPLVRLRSLLAPGALWWFRTCETFGARAGHDFARRFTDTLGCAAGGHTHIIGPWQSGLHRLAPGEHPHWPAEEGLAAGTPASPEKALWSAPGRPNTITCLRGTIPSGY